MELLQIATAQFITKCDGLLLQIAKPFLLQSATRFITNCDRYYKVRWIYYKSRQVLQSATIITNCDSTYGTSVFLTICYQVKNDTNKLSLISVHTFFFSYLKLCTKPHFQKEVCSQHLGNGHSRSQTRDPFGQRQFLMRGAEQKDRRLLERIIAARTGRIFLCNNFIDYEIAEIQQVHPTGP